MNAASYKFQDTALARARLLEIKVRCASDRYAFFPKHARSTLTCGPGSRIVVFGTRGLGFSQQLDQIEHVAGLNPGMAIAAIVDDTVDGPVGPVIAGRVREYPTVTPAQFFARARDFADCLVVDRTCTWYPGVRYKVRLKQAGFAFLRMEQFLNAPDINIGAGYYRAHSDTMLERFEEFIALESLLGDELSLQTYYYALAAFISMNHEFFAFHCGDYRERYLPHDIGLSFDDSTVYVDCGSHDGQEVLYFAQLFMGRFRALHAFEPDKRNYLRLCDNINAYIGAQGVAPIYCHQFGVYDCNAFVETTGYDAGVTIVNRTDAPASGIHVCRLDDAIDEVSHLRLEIEGAELPALRGAVGLIQRCRPTMAVSVYHRPDDFVDVMRFVTETKHDYRMLLRHQSLEPGVLCIYCT